MTVKWSDIEADCQPYRAGFVATFLKYQGQDTDEINSRGSVVKVTEASFARHNGIARQTFQRWVKAAKKPTMGTLSPPPQPQPQPAATSVPVAATAPAPPIAIPAPMPTPPPAPTMASFPPCVQVTFLLADMETHLTEVLDQWDSLVTDPVERDEIRDRLRDQTGPLFAKVAALFGVTL